jgi:hypothetical protein
MNETIRKIVFGRKGKRATTQQHSSSNVQNPQSAPKMVDSEVLA